MSNERELTYAGSSGMTVLLAFLVGAAAGAVAVLLTTPKTGTEMRSTIRDWAKSLSDREGRDAEVSS